MEDPDIAGVHNNHCASQVIRLSVRLSVKILLESGNLRSAGFYYKVLEVHILDKNNYQEAFKLGPNVPCRSGFHSVTTDSRVPAQRYGLVYFHNVYVVYPFNKIDPKATFPGTGLEGKN